MKKIFILLFGILTCLTANAQDGDVKTESLIKKRPTTSTERPRTLLPSYLECSYTAEYLSIALPDEIEQVYVTITNDDDAIVWSGYITHEQPEATLPTLSGEFVITSTTESGIAYSGILDLEE